MLVENKSAHIIQIPALLGDAERKQPAHEALALLPGITDVPDAQWAHAKKHATITHRIEGWDDYVVDRKRKFPGSEPTLVERGAQPLAKRPEAEACAVIRACWDAEQLKSWQLEDARTKVQKAIHKQLDACGLTDDERKRASGEE